MFAKIPYRDLQALHVAIEIKIEIPQDFPEKCEKVLIYIAGLGAV